MTDLFFQTQRLCVGYDGKPLIEGIQIGLEQGEILTLIGPNGAGKSTVLKSIAGQLAPLGGTVYLDKRPADRMTKAQLARQIAIVLTSRLRGEMMTCGEVVATGRYPYTGYFGLLSEADRQIVEEAMEMVHMREWKERPFSRISDGQRQRVMLARAICQQPRLLILDEPTSYLDVRHQLEFLSLLQKMCRKMGLTVIMSLHELELAAKVSDRVCCLKGRYVDRYGRPEEVFTGGYVSSLFGVSLGSYDEINGGMELEPALGQPQVFVIAGAGTGRSVYRRLQRKGIPFATGILFSNDLDYPVAKALAADCIASEGLEPMGEALFEAARQRVDACGRVICCRERFGALEEANGRLLSYAKSRGKEIEEPWRK